MRLLIAEDSEIERLVLREAVEGLGHECLVAADGVEAWDLFQRTGADVVVTDWLMPGLEGPELCRRVRAHPAASYTYLILLTALDDRVSTLAGMAAGADDYLTKPLEIADLEARLVAAARVTELHRNLSRSAAERERTLARREGLLRLARQLAAESDPERLLSALLAETTALMGATGGVVSRWDESQRVLAPIRSTIPASINRGDPSLAREASNDAALRRSIVVLDDPAAADAFEMRAAAAAPLVHSGRLLGVLAVATRQPDAHFSVEDLDLLRQAAEIGSAELVGLDRARSEGALLAVQALEAAQPWAASGASTRPMLPIQATTLVGRDREVELVRDLLLRGRARLVTLTGPAGIGKTRLAVAVASGLADSFEQRVFFVDLQPVRESTQVLSAVAHTLGARGVDDPAAWLRAELGERAVLLVVDNFEHVVAAAPELASLVEACSGLKALVTSREALRVRSEHEVSVPPLEVPDLARAPSLEQLARTPAVALFVERAQAADLGFELTEANASVVAELCARLDGLPLAIELAAARSRVLPPEALRNRLQQQSLGLLSGGPRDQPERHQTLRNAIAWSYDLLPPEEQALFRQLGVFAGGCTLEAATAVSGAGRNEEEIVEPIAALVSKSLLVTSMQPDGHPRYRLLETIRQFALEQLTAADELRPALERHARFYLALAEQAAAAATGRDQGAWLDRLEWEHENLLAALRWAARHHEPDLELRLCGALAWFWLARGYELEAREVVESALVRARPAAIDPAADVSAEAGPLADQTSAAPAASQEAVASALLARALLAARTGDWRLSREALEQRLALGARDAQGLLGLALARLRLGDRGAARALAGDALALATERADRAAQARALRLQAEIATERGDFAQASNLLSESLRGWSDLRDTLLLASCLDTCAGLAAARTHAARALRLASAAAALRESVGAPLRGAERAALDRWLTLARQSLGPEGVDQAEAEGRALSPEQAIEEATARPEPSVAGPDASDLRPLSYREAEVALLVARGWTNAQIGAELHLSERTVEAHLRRITHKLGFASRTQLAAWTVQRTSTR